MGEIGYNVEFSPPALRDLEEIVAFIGADDPTAEERFAHRLIEQAEAIAAHPFSGRMVPEFRDTRVREKIFRAYRIAYRVDEDRRVLVVSRFWHAARGTPIIEETDDDPSLSD